MMRRAGLLAAGAALFLSAGAAPAWAHGIGGRLDLPVPRSLFVFGASAALLVSFVLLSFLWKEPRLQDGGPTRFLPRFVQAVATNTAVEWALRLISLAFFLVVLIGALGGSRSRNLAPVAIFVWFWVGLAFIHAAFGNWWATLSPWDTLARLLGLEEDRRGYPASWGKWPGVAALFAFVWMELTGSWGASARSLGVAMLVYSAISLAGMSVFGRGNWADNGEGFAVYFGLFSRIAPFVRDHRGRITVRVPLAGLPSLAPQPGLVAFVVVMLGSTTFDGFSRLAFWTQRVDLMSKVAKLGANTVGLVAVILLVWGAYELAIVAAAAISRGDRRALSVKFIHSLVPIALAYVVAHYFSLLMIEGQMGFSQISDPFGGGWNLFGTAAWAVNLNVVSINTIWYVQVFAIIAGHLGGVTLAHDRAVALWEPKLAVRTQYAMLAVMILFTAVGLFILSGG